MTQAVSLPRGGDTKVIGLIGVAHALSHFFQLVLPPLFPFLRESFGVGYAELGFLMTLFFVASGFAQTASGFVVDRLGARSVLFCGIGLLAASVLLMGLAPAFWMLMPLAMLAGIGNSVFHPADYTILTSCVREGRLGRAYGIHTLGGNLGWALAPVTMLTLATLFDWRAALIVVGGAGLAVLAILISQGAALRHEPAARRREKPRETETEVEQPSALAILMQRPVVLCFVYFMFLSVALIAVQNFLPATLLSMYGTPLTLGGAALTAFLLGASAGVLGGGLLADRSRRHDLVVNSGLAASAALILLVGHVDLPAAGLIGALALAGFASGITTPSRDMLVRAASPKGATGRVFGFVYSGLDAGSAIAPFLIGLMLDRGQPGLVFWFIAAVLVAAMLSVAAIRRSGPARPVTAEA